MAKMKYWTGTAWIVMDAKDADTVDGKHAADFAPVSHVGSGGDAHSLATAYGHGFIPKDDKAKLNRLVIHQGVLYMVPPEFAGSGEVTTLPAGAEVIAGAGGGGGALDQLTSTFTLGADSNTATIGIAEYNQSTDVLMVYQGSTFLQVGTDYTISTDGLSIVKTSGVWLKGTVIDFVVLTSFDATTAQYLRYTELSNTVTVGLDNTAQIPVGIVDFLPSVDLLQVYQGNIRLFEGINYTLDTNTSVISLLNYVANKGDVFTFVILKKVKDQNWESGTLKNHSFSATNPDTSGIYKTIEYRREDGTVALTSAVSEPNMNGHYTKSTVNYYGADGTTVILTKTWTIGYDNDGTIISRTVS